ncbi:hypothetical protein [Polyangium spumosum]|uniref:DUF2345 domain-containing protein n=1 Tax=Polyangium spumosum TaxID=889282 RepID=A0A6N7PZP2_9BACT|nr:hypothetical protein [Polyangium spumosum]MRG96356.1 hypothetical protein [Polyangium spumosum]
MSDPKNSQPAGDEHASARESLTLVGGHALTVERNPQNNVLRVVGPNGAVGVSITITPQAITVSLAGADLLLETTGKLAVRADELSLHGERGVSVTTGGDAVLRAEGDLHSEARIQNIQATLGNVNVRANDDVQLDGERIRLNSPDAAPPMPWPKGGK